MDISKTLTDLADLYKRTDDEIHEDLKKADMLSGAPANAANTALAITLQISIERKKAWLNGVDATLKAIGVRQLRTSDGSMVYPVTQ